MLCQSFSQKNQNKVDEPQAKNGQIFYYLQNSLTNVSLAELSFSSRPSYPHQVLICGTYVLPQLRKFQDSLQNELLDKDPYAASIGDMKLTLQKLQAKDQKARKLKAYL